MMSDQPPIPTGHSALEGVQQAAPAQDSALSTQHSALDPGAIIAGRGLVKRFGHLEVLRGVDLQVAEGEVVVVLGPSGSGKSTLLRCLNRLEVLDGGELWVVGIAVHDR